MVGTGVMVTSMASVVVRALVGVLRRSVMSTGRRKGIKSKISYLDAILVKVLN
jgi:hypothetical protein